MEADHGGAAEIAPFGESLFTIGLRLKFCLDVIHEKKIAGMKVHCQPEAGPALNVTLRIRYNQTRFVRSLDEAISTT